jgi:hypothetical protein
MGVKNSTIQLRVETCVKDKIKLEAYKQGTSMTEFCRTKIRETPKLERIELMLEDLLKRKRY